MSELKRPDLITPLAGTVILFNPGAGVFDKIRSYIQSLDRLYLVDNTARAAELPEDLKKDPRVVYLPQMKNLGQAAALNLAAARARQDGYEWLLTMDQDSSFEAPVLEAYLQAFRDFPESGECALFSPAHHSGFNLAGALPGVYSEPETLMTSGNLLNLRVHASLGGFEEPLFIDTVDHDYCLRARLSGFRLIRFDSLVMNHVVGDGLWVRQRGQKIRITTHPPQRMYTITRNNLRLWWKFYPLFPEYIKHRVHFYFFRTLLNILLYEDQKFSKLGFSLRGAIDFFRGRYGPVPSERKPVNDRA